MMDHLLEWKAHHHGKQKSRLRSDSGAVFYVLYRCVFRLLRIIPIELKNQAWRRTYGSRRNYKKFLLQTVCPDGAVYFFDADF